MSAELFKHGELDKENSVMNKSRTDVYIKTGTTGFLALMKFAEALFAAFLIIDGLMNRQELRETIEQYLNVMGIIGIRSYYQLYLNIFFSILIANAALLLIDGIACVCVRIKGKGASVVAICHMIRSVFLVFALISVIISTFSGLSDTHSMISESNNGLLLLFSPYIATHSFINVITAIERAVGLGIVALYHFSVFRTMWYVSNENRADKLFVLKGKPYSLVGRANTIGVCIIIGVLIDLIFVKADFGTILSAHAIYTEPAFLGFVNYPIISIVVLVFVVLKFFVVSGCARGFSEIHTMQEDNENYFTKVRSAEALKGGEADQSSFQFNPDDLENHNTIALVQQNPYRRWTDANIVSKDLQKHFLWLSGHPDGKKLELFAEGIEYVKDFKGITITDASFSHCVFYQMDLTRTTFQHCDLSYSVFIDCKTEKNDISRVQYGGRPISVKGL